MPDQPTEASETTGAEIPNLATPSVPTEHTPPIAPLTADEDMIESTSVQGSPPDE